jgi:hypothetical protein
MPNLHQLALDALGARLECDIPELRDRVCVGQADWGHELEFPHATIVPLKRSYEPHQADIVRSASTDRAVANVGSHEGAVLLTIGTRTSGARGDLEQRVFDVFLSDELRPGVVLVDFQCDAGIHRASFTLEDDDWRDQGASDQEFYSQITLEGTHPAIAVYRQVHTIDKVQVDLDTGGPIETTVIQEPP